MKYTIYKTTNLINNKIYIGKHQTQDPNDGYIGSGKYLNKAIEKYGRENFVKEVLYVFDNEAAMNAKEKELVTEEFLARDDVYNLCPGGQGGFGYINSNDLRTIGHTREMYNKISLKMKNRKNPRFSEISKKRHKMGLVKYDTFRGKTHTEEWKRNHSKTMKIKSAGSNNSQYGTMWITNSSDNKKIKAIDTIPEGWYKGRNCKT